MKVDFHGIDDLESGRLATMPCPRVAICLRMKSTFERPKRRRRSLAPERKEIVELGYSGKRRRLSVKWHSSSFPIQDRNVPASATDALEFAHSILDLLRSGKSVVIHCRGGIGRSAVIAACVLMHSGIPVDEAFEMIEKARGCLVPDTQEQREWVQRLAKSF